MTPAEIESARELKRAGASWMDLARRYGRDERGLRRTIGKKLWPDDGPRETEPPVLERAPDTARSVELPALDPVPTPFRDAVVLLTTEASSEHMGAISRETAERSRRAVHEALATPAPEAVRFAPPSTPPERTDLERVFFIPDTHVPFEDGQAWAVAMAAARAFRPHRVVLLGDFADFYAVSFHSKDPSRRASLKDELEAVNARLDEIHALGAERVDYVAGNHEHRMERWIADKAPELFGMLTLPGILRIEERGWRWHPYRKQSLKIGKLHVTHDVGHAGVFAHRRSRVEYEGNVILGHSHRLSMEVQGTAAGSAHIGVMVGWLGDRHAVDYMHETKAAQWSHGFGLAYHERDTGNVHVVPVPIVDYRCVVEGHLIDPFRGTSADTRLKRVA